MRDIASIFSVFDKSEAADEIAVLPRPPPVGIDPIQAVVSVAFVGRVGRSVIRSSHHADGESIQAAGNKSLILAGEGLIGDLPAGGGIASSMAGIDDDVAFIAVIRVPTREHDALGTLFCRSRDSGLRSPMDTCGSEFSPGREYGSGRDAGQITDGHMLSFSSRFLEPFREVWIPDQGLSRGVAA